MGKRGRGEYDPPPPTVSVYVHSKDRVTRGGKGEGERATCREKQAGFGSFT